MAKTMSNYNSYAANNRMPAGNPRGARPQSARPADGARNAKGKAKPPVQKNRRREKDYFFIMRRGVCFIIMVLALLWVGVIAVNYLGVLPQYTSFLVVPDLTPLDEREDVVSDELDEEGNKIVLEYQDKSVYISLTDPLFGALKKLVGLEMTDSEGNSMSGFYDSFSPAISGKEVVADESGEDEEEEEVAEAAAETDAEADADADAEEGEGAAEGDEADEEESTGVKFGTVPARTDIDEAAREEDSMGSIASLVFDYAPVLLILGAVFALIVFILAFLSLFGRRIFKGFGLMSLVMLLAGVAMLLAGMAAMGNYTGNPSFDAEGTVVSVLDFSKLTSFALGAFEGAPATALDPEVDAMPLTMVAGYGLLIEVILPVVMIILSIFARKKVPYSIFDK